ncbi:glycosyltransferase [Zwartia panacis]|uniref:glycosyltransferase n=1 Tax=Zwartia panacis TaxID=2683345 RepID=UPI0025B29B1A|nr:glycosyltransferase [Zwartia panacis]MDN4018049.1 glycosyltransferase [Zwartia panacis]
MTQLAANMTDSRFAVVMPIYEDQEASTRLFRELSAEYGDRVYVVAVDDGSVNQPVHIEALKTNALNGVVIQLKRNVGHQRAIAIGINYVADHFPDMPCTVVMDSDGEDTPQSIRELVAPMQSPKVDVVVAQRKSRVETLRFKTFYLIYKLLFQFLTGRKISFGNFMALKPSALKRLAAMQELWMHVASCVLTSKLRIQTLPVERGPRYAGKSKMNFVGLALHGFRALMVFAEDVLVRVGIVCALVAVATVIASAVAIVLKLAGFATPGWFSVALGILLLVLLQTGALTLMTLMLTGVVRSGAPNQIDYRSYIADIKHVQ